MTSISDDFLESLGSKRQTSVVESERRTTFRNNFVGVMGKTSASKEAHLPRCEISPLVMCVYVMVIFSVHLQSKTTMTNCLGWAKMQKLILFSTEHLVVSLGY